MVSYSLYTVNTYINECLISYHSINDILKGFPYADCFVVEVRHVASCVGDNDLQIQIGMFVRFLKVCMCVDDNIHKTILTNPFSLPL